MIAELKTVAFDAPDIDAEAGFYAALAGWSRAWTEDDWITMETPDGWQIAFDVCLNENAPATTVAGVMLDCPDATALSSFYSTVTGKAVTFEMPGAAMIGEEGAMPIMFQQVDDYRAPRWPDPAHPQQVHLDLRVAHSELEQAEQAVLDIGATKLPGHGENWRVYADPAGKPFCFVWPDGS